MTDAIIQAFFYAGLAAIVVAMLYGLAKQQLYLYRANRRLQSLKNLRRR